MPGASSNRVDRLNVALGIVSPVLALVSILLATVLSARFSWTANALSDLGRSGWDSTLVFNGGLFVSGVLALGFAVALVRRRRNVADSLAAVVFAVAAIALASIGVFALPSPDHGTVAVTFFVAFTVVFVLYGVGDLLAGALARGFVTVSLAVLHVAAWVVWASVGPSGMALPETVGSVLLSAWMIVTAGRFLGS